MCWLSCPPHLSKAQSPAPLTQVKFDLRKLYVNSPAAAVSAILAGSLSGAWGNFAPVFAKMTAMSNADIANMLVAAVIGSFIFQLPIGRLSDRMDRRYVMIGTSICGALAGFLLTRIPVENGEPGWLFFGSIVVFGGFIYSIYSIAVAHANDHAAPRRFCRNCFWPANFVWRWQHDWPDGDGPDHGPYGAGRIVLWHGSCAYRTVAIYITYRVTMRALPKDHETVDFQSVPIGKAQTPETYALDRARRCRDLR